MRSELLLRASISAREAGESCPLDEILTVVMIQVELLLLYFGSKK